MRVLAVTQIWPNSREPLSSSFNRQQFRELAALCDLRVLAAIPYFPGAKWLGAMPRREPLRAALLADLPDHESIDGIPTHYMRQVYVPKVGLAAAVPLYLASLVPHRRLIADCDVLLGTWAYPDGCAAIAAAGVFGKPSAVKVHGTDINGIAKRPTARAVLRRALPRVSAAVAVSRPLARELEQLGAPPSRVHVVENGVDTSVFAPRDRAEARRRLGLPEGGRVVLFVGRLEPQKGVFELMEAWDGVRRAHPDAVLAMVGEGESRPEVDAWCARVAASGAEGSVRAPGARPLREIAEWMAACDLFVLPSWMEGTPNVVLEALASGRPVVATRVGGIPDVLGDAEAGTLVPAKDPKALEAALLAGLSRSWDVERVRVSGPRSWRESAAALYEVLERARAIHRA